MSYKILVPTDFSATADKAFVYALELGSKCGATIFLCHIHSPVESPFIETVEIRRDYNQAQERALMGRLHELRNRYQPNYPDVSIVAVLGRSPLVDTLLKFVSANEIDLIIMGTQGASGIRRVIVGTIAARILERSPVPLLLVPERFEWKEPKSIVLATNYNEEDAAAMRLSGWIASLYNAAIEVVHLPSADAEREKAENSLSRYTAELAGQAAGVPLHSRILMTYSVFDTLETLHEELPYDILVMVRHKKNLLQRVFLESCTRHMAYLTLHPLLVIPAPEPDQAKGEK